MKRLTIILLAMTFAAILAVSCGNKNRQVQDKTEDYKKAEEERNREMGYTPAPPPVKGPSVLADSLKPGTSAWVAGKFGMALASMDSAAAMSYCSDTVKILVKALFMDQGQIESMKRAREQGFKIKSVAIINNPVDTTLCTACVTANISNTDVEDCSFHLRLEHGEWKIYNIGH